MFRLTLIATLTLVLLAGSAYRPFYFAPPASVLADGEIYKISVDKAGIFKMDYNYLKSELGIEIDSKDPRKIQLFGFGGGILPERVTYSMQLELPEIALSVSGESDGKFDTKDYILFYSPGPDHLAWSGPDSMFLVNKNNYSRTAIYFLKVSTTPGRRIKSSAPVNRPIYDTLKMLVDVQHLEDEKINLLAGRTSTYGSGKNWYGDYFKTIRKKDYSSFFNFKDAIPNSSTKVKLGFAARSDAFTKAYLQVYNSKFEIPLNTTNTADVEDDIARESQVRMTAPHLAGNPNLILDYPSTSSPSEGWLDYITINIRKPIIYEGTPVRILQTPNKTSAVAYTILNGSDKLEVWNIKSFNNPEWVQTTVVQSQLKLSSEQSEVPDAFMVFDPQTDLPKPVKVGRITNQNLAGLADCEAIVLYHPLFENAAKKLAQHRTSFSGIQTVPILVDLVYNEFGSGQPDPTSIRNFVKHLLSQHPGFRYLILLGDGSYDYLGLNKELAKNENFIPVYETEESLSPLYAFPTDDFYALLEDGEGGTDLTGDLDLAVGRIPVRNKEEADQLVDKIIQYDKNKDTQGDWKLRVAFSADDEDGNIHLEQTESISNSVQAQHPDLNLQKIYLDAFKQESGTGGEIIPGANQSLNQNIFQGLLVFNYLGHGGPKGLSQEGLLRNTDVEAWTNKSRLPLVITATCSFAPYDDPAIPSTGEALFRSPYGGAIALLTTVRNVYSSSNEVLTSAVFDQLFVRKSNGKAQTLGDIMTKAKNSISANGFDRLNARKFALLGDPTQSLAIPEYQVNTTHINGKPIQVSVRDTLKALQLLEVKGEITDALNQPLTAFNGNVSVTLFDKKTVVKTLGQNSSSYAKSFQVQNSILFRGNASVIRGKFEIRFVIPKDIDYTYGPAKLSYYANSIDSMEASGYFDNIVIGGSQSEIPDNLGPIVKPFINHFQFKDGQSTHSNPLLLVDIVDDNGINATGNSIGHDLVAILDRDTKKQYVLNTFYESSKGDYKKGQVTFPFSGLSPGLHHVKVIAWDVANNSGEGEISFWVTDPKTKARILNLQAIPNPATSQFKIQVIHDLGNLSDGRLKLSLMDYSGRIIITKEEVLSPAAVLTTEIEFDLAIPAGIYLVQAEIWNQGKRVDIKGIKVLRIP